MWEDYFGCVGVVVVLGCGVFVDYVEELVYLVLCVVELFGVGLVVGVVIDCFVVVVVDGMV